MSGTDPADENADPAPREDRFTLSYYTGEDLDPYTSLSRTNSELLRLCYSGLFTVDGEYNALPVMAESYEVEGNTVTVTLRSELLFSDGTAVSAEDCRQSYDRAKKKDSVWANAFAYIRSYRAVDEKTFQIVFRSFSPTQLNLLNIPVVKGSSIDASGYPVGCGRYRVDNVSGLELVKADCRCIAGDYSLDRIPLLGIADRETMIYNFNYGRLHAIYADLSLGAKEFRSDSEMITIPTNRLTFLVVNKSRNELADVNFSKGLTYLIDREALVSQSLNGFAAPVWYPLNPAWTATKQAKLNPNIFSTVSAGNAFADAGFVLDGDVREYQGKPVTLRILVNRENASRVKAAEQIGESLRAAGFSVEVVQATWDEYQKALANLDFDLYLGEVNLPNNLDLSALFSTAVCNTGEGEGVYEALRSRAVQVLTDTESVPSFVSSFQNEMPLIPLYYSLDALAVNVAVTGDFGGSVTEFYAGIEDWVLQNR